MKLKHLLILIVIFAVLTALVVLKKAERDRGARKAAQADARTASLTGDIDEDFVDRVILYKGDPEKKIVLSRQGDGWVLDRRNGIRARTERVSQLIKDMQNIRGELRGVSAQAFADFGIADDEGLHVILQTGAETDIAHLVFGMKSPRLGVVFCRRADSEETLMVSSRLPISLGVPGAESQLKDDPFVVWRIYSDKVKEAGRIEVTNPAEKGSFVLIKGEDGVWIFDPPQRRQEPDKEKVEGFLKVLSEVEGRRLVDPEEGVDYGLEAPAGRVVVTVFGSATKEGVAEEDVAEEGVAEEDATEAAETLSIFDIRVGRKVPDSPGMYFVKALPQDIIYWVPENAAGNLIVTREGFAASPRKR